MRETFTRISAAVLLFGSILLLTAQGLDIRPGLWEMTITNQISGAPPEIVKMTPRSSLAPGTRTLRTCATVDLQKNLLSGLGIGQSCRRTVGSDSSKLLEIKFECGPEDRKTTGTLRYEALSPDRVRGSARMTSVEPGQSVTYDISMTGRRVADFCSSK